MKNRTRKILDFLSEIEKFKLVKRVPYLSDKKTLEDDAQHTWHTAMMLLTLEKEFKNKFDVLKTLKLILMHDLVEIYTGDDWVTTPEAKAFKRKKEVESADKLFPILPNDVAKEFRDLWEEYDAGRTIEAKIAKGLDKLNYSLQYNISDKVEWFKEGDTIPETIEYAKPHTQIEPIMDKIMEVLMKEREEKEAKGNFGMPGQVKFGTVAEAVSLSNQIPEFDQKFDNQYFTQRYKNKGETIMIAYINNMPVGFLIAYDRFQDGSYYCWMAGVIPKYRQKGMLKLLMGHLEDLARRKGYKSVKIKTRNNRRGMLNYLVHHDYNVVETSPRDKITDNRILFMKTLLYEI